MAESNILVIESNYRRHGYWHEIFEFRELLLLLVWRDILVRYKQTVFGLAWALIRPIVTMVVFTVIFGKLAGLSSGEIPYPLLVFSGVLAWQFFATAFADAANSVVGNANMIAKVYFPRMLVPLGAVMVGIVDFLITLGIYIALSIWFGYAPDWHILFLPIFAAILFLFIFSIGIWFAALNVRYRDVRYVLPFLIQLGSYASPVGFSSGVVPHNWQFIYSLNPLVGIIDGFRWALLRGSTNLSIMEVSLSCLITATLLVPGIRSFVRQERSFADVI